MRRRRRRRRRRSTPPIAAASDEKDWICSSFCLQLPLASPPLPSRQSVARAHFAKVGGEVEEVENAAVEENDKCEYYVGAA